MNSPEVSIAMPFYNSSDTIAVSVRSLLNQTFENFELLLCDDGSSDNSLEIVRQFSDPRIVCWSDGQRRRLPARLNQCIDRARAPLFARMDSDDVACPDRLARQLEFLGNHPEVDLCGGGFVSIGKHSTPLWVYRPATDHSDIVRAPYLGFPMPHNTWMGPTDWFRKWRYTEVTYGRSAHLAEDQELLIRSYKDSTFANLPETLVGYRQETVPLKKLYRYKLLWVRYICESEGCPETLVGKLRLILTQGVRFTANCVAKVLGPGSTLCRQGAFPLSVTEKERWNELLLQLSA